MRRREIYDGREPPAEPENEENKRNWDSFRNKPRKIESGSTAEPKYIEAGTKFLKILTVVATFSIVLGAAVVSKGTLLFMTSQIRKGVTRSYCNKKIEPNQEFQVTLPDSERVVWMWLIIFSYMVPELGTFLRSVRILCFKSWSFPTIWEFFWLFLTETLPAIGSAMLVFVIFPELDVIKAAMLTNCVCIVPAFVTFFSRNPHSLNSILRMVLDILAIVAQASAFVVWPLVDRKLVLYIIPISLIFISFGWWENFVSEKSPLGFIQKLAESKKEFKNKTYFMYAIIAPWRCIMFFVTAVVCLVIREGDATFLFTEFLEAFQSHQIYVNETGPSMGDSSVIYEDAIASGFGTVIEASVWTPISVWLINSFCTYLCYIIGKFSCKIMIQTPSFALPINLTVPVLLSGLIGFSGRYNKDVCAYTNIIPEYLFFNTPSKYSLNEFISHQHSWIWLIWLLSQFWITLHIWTNNNEKLASTEKLFLRPMYDAYLIDQALALNRRKIEYDMKPPIKVDNRQESSLETNKHKITRIYACGTMWHETKEEMVEFLKSILRMDEDQCAHRIVRDYLQYNLNNYYELESHIMFDDAFVRTSQEDQDPHINQYVLDLIESVGIAAEEVHKTNVMIQPPVIYATPYGGRLVWTLPGKTKMIAHLKDKAKIKPKKRWSQVMYMYYILGHRIMENYELTPESVATVSENTYLLALDGDTDFQPNAVHLLMDYMKKNRCLGAACGRLHPVGSGIMIWYQIFEYAISHWLHKATEHVIGCVLCSPGCFSLFRAKALMDDNVMAKYTTISEEARHYLQHDQGEDRWLCTLLLQRGYRVEYSAASDAYTHCPEGFSEFYNQRRRWMPSTAAHIIDLLMDYKHIVKINDNISKLFILYQMFVLSISAIGPGTIFLMLVGGFVAVFKLDHWTSFAWNIVPILIFVLVCATCKADRQLFVAGIISAVYGLVMMAVLIAIIMQMVEDWLNLSSLLFIFLTLEFIIAGIIHPKEFYCLKYGLIYYLTVPSMYMLLVIYSLFNLNSVSWGTREVTVVPKPEKRVKNEKERKVMDEKKPENNHKIYSFFENNKDNAGSFEFSCAGLFKIFCCTHQKNGEESQILKNVQTSVMRLEQKLDQIERIQFEPEIPEQRRPTSRRPTHLEGSRASRTSSIRNSSGYILKNYFENVNEDYDDDSILTTADNTEENSWFYDLKKSEVAHLEVKEETFWTNVIEKYLQPIDDDSIKKDKVTKNLKDLRDKMVVIFIMINSLFVLVIFFLTVQRKTVRMTWLIDPKINFTYVLDQNEIQIQKTYLELEPIGFVFLILFAVLIVIQFIGMLVHRFGTYSQIMANTLINWYPFKCLSKNMENLTEEQILEQDPVKIFKKLMKLKGINDEDEDNDIPVTRRNTVLNIALCKKSNERIEDLERAFSVRMGKILNSDNNDKLPVPRKTLLAIEKRRETLLRRITQTPSHFVNMGDDGDDVGGTLHEPPSQASNCNY